MRKLCGVLFLSALLCGFADSSRRTSGEGSAAIVYIDANNSFIVIDRGRKEGMGPGLTFEITRGGSTIVGKARFEKFLGEESMSKLAIVAGDPEAIRHQDRVVYRIGP